MNLYNILNFLYSVSQYYLLVYVLKGLKPKRLGIFSIYR